MSPILVSSPSDSPLADTWAGKSRNAKAQARHRAKRKAYIDQLEQTVSKLQTALALSTEDVANLPTTHIKLRELKEENDSLRAEIRKLQTQQPPSISTNFLAPAAQMHSPASSDDYPTRPKRRRMSPAYRAASPPNTYLASTLYLARFRALAPKDSRS
ncbi:hypothetical protein K439DRAFT_1621020 [Ramaria rubella]|nr:hypothetical protein K439DRAFT_1621020 [Ramaria rubella]